MDDNMFEERIKLLVLSCFQYITISLFESVDLFSHPLEIY